MSIATAEKPKKVFRLKHGQHIGVDPAWNGYAKDDKGKDITIKEGGQPILIPEKVYTWNKPGENIIRTHEDLCEKFGDKFERVPTGMDDSLAGAANSSLLAEIERLKSENSTLKGQKDHLTTGSNEDLAPLNPNQLRELAAAEEIDLGKARQKDEMSKVITDARAARVKK